MISLEVYHTRTFPEGPVGFTTVTFTLETRGQEHAKSVVQKLEEEGFLPKEEK